VSTLIDPDTGAWDSDVIKSFFDDVTAAKILQIPLSRRGGDDYPSWPHAKYGVYTMRSAYNLARSQQIVDRCSLTNRGLQSDTSAEEKLWNIKALGKMKITLWRLAQECLPSGFQLRQRNRQMTHVTFAIEWKRLNIRFFLPLCCRGLEGC
jgi:hypothetical protein